MSVSRIVWSSGGESMVAIKSPVFAPPNGSKPTVLYKSKGYIGKLNTLVAKSNFWFFRLNTVLLMPKDNKLHNENCYCLALFYELNLLYSSWVFSGPWLEKIITEQMFLSGSNCYGRPSYYGRPHYCLSTTLLAQPAPGILRPRLRLKTWEWLLWP